MCICSLIWYITTSSEIHPLKDNLINIPRSSLNLKINWFTARRWNFTPWSSKCAGRLLHKASKLSRTWLPRKGTMTARRSWCLLECAASATHPARGSLRTHPPSMCSSYQLHPGRSKWKPAHVPAQPRNTAIQKLIHTTVPAHHCADKNQVLVPFTRKRHIIATSHRERCYQVPRSQMADARPQMVWTAGQAVLACAFRRFAHADACLWHGAMPKGANSRRRLSRTGRNRCRSVNRSLSLGFTHIDTSEVYPGFDAVGEAVLRSLPRERAFVTSKVDPASTWQTRFFCGAGGSGCAKPWFLPPTARCNAWALLISCCFIGRLIGMVMHRRNACD